MAGSDPTSDGDIKLIDVDALLGRIESQRGLLQQIADNTKSANRSRTIIRLTVTSGTVTNIYRDHVRVFVETIIVAATVLLAGDTFTLLVGSINHRFRLAGISPVIVPFPIVIDRGVDVQGQFATSTAIGDVYIIGTVE